MALGYFVDAEKYLSEAVASPDHPWVAKNLATLKAQLATAKTQIGELYIVGEPAGAEVLVNGKSVGKLPLSSPIRLDKGRADVQVRAPGYVSSTDSVVMVGGKREDRSYRLQREAVAVAPPPPAPAQRRLGDAQAGRGDAAAPSVAMATPPPAPGRRTGIGSAAGVDHRDARARGRQWRPFVSASGGVGRGHRRHRRSGVRRGRRRHRDQEAQRVQRSHRPGPANPLSQTIPDCNTTALTAACQDIQDSHESARTLSIIGFVAGGVLDGGRGGAVGAVVTQGARRGLQHRSSPAPLISGRVVLPVGCSSRRSPDAA